jgi:hypothetical protein
MPPPTLRGRSKTGLSVFSHKEAQEECPQKAHKVKINQARTIKPEPIKARNKE